MLQPKPCTYVRGINPHANLVFYFSVEHDPSVMAKTDLRCGTVYELRCKRLPYITIWRRAHVLVNLCTDDAVGVVRPTKGLHATKFAQRGRCPGHCSTATAHRCSRWMLAQSLGCVKTTMSHPCALYKEHEHAAVGTQQSKQPPYW